MSKPEQLYRGLQPYCRAGTLPAITSGWRWQRRREDWSVVLRHHPRNKADFGAVTVTTPRGTRLIISPASFRAHDRLIPTAAVAGGDNDAGCDHDR